MSDNTYTTSRGVMVRFIGIASLIDKLNGEFKDPEPPYYEVKTMTGVTEKHAHDDTTVQTDEEKAMLAEYKRQLADIAMKRNRAAMRATLLCGLEVEIPPDDEWVKRHEFIGFHVPTDPIERRLHYLETEVMGDAQDYVQIMAGVQRASGVSEESLAAMVDSFRHSMGQSNGNETGGHPPIGNGQGVVLQQTIRGDRGSHRKRRA